LEEARRAQALADAELERRGNARMRAQLQDQMRIYNPAEENGWQRKYQFFSGHHMKGKYRVYARARHDPFNKDPSWGTTIIKQVASECAAQGKDLKDVFKNVDVEGDGQLSRPEVKKALTSVMPALSDMEVSAIFDTIDSDRSGEVEVQEFLQTLETCKNTKIVPGAAERWRNPIHRITRFPPSRLEGWDHVDTSAGCSHVRYDKLCQDEAEKVMGRLGQTLAATPRAIQHTPRELKYDRFAGGGDSSRFRRQAWLTQDRPGTSSRPEATASGQRPRSELGPRRPATVPTFEFADPGGDVRPGFLCDAKARKTQVVQGFAALTPRTKTTKNSSVGPLSARR